MTTGCASFQTQKKVLAREGKRELSAPRDLDATFYIWSKRVRRLEISEIRGLRQGEKREWAVERVVSV